MRATTRRSDRDRFLANLPDPGSLGTIADIRIGSQTFRPPKTPEGIDSAAVTKTPKQLFEEISRVIEAGKLLGLASREGSRDDSTEEEGK